MEIVSISRKFMFKQNGENDSSCNILLSFRISYIVTRVGAEYKSMYLSMSTSTSTFFCNVLMYEYKYFGKYSNTSTFLIL